MIDEPIIADSEAVSAAVIHLSIPREQIHAEMDPAIHELLDTVKAAGAQLTGPLYSYHLRFSDTEFDFEVGIPVSVPISPKGRVKMSGVPAARVARTMYRGPYDGLLEAWREFGEWMKREGHKGKGQLWERYVVDPAMNPDPAQWQTELNIPLEQ